MLAFIASHLIEIFFGLVSIGAATFCKYMYEQMKIYKQLLEKEEDGELKGVIDQHLAPTKEEIDAINKRIDDLTETESHHIELILASYRFRLLQLCKGYLKQGFMTQEQFDQLSELHKLYHSLGGNGQTHEYYEKAAELEIREE